MKTVAIIGRPNVGKSSVFNALLQKRLAITHQRPGVTRDLKKAEIEISHFKITIIDTGGISKHGQLSQSISNLSKTAIEQADLILLLLSCEEITSEDEEIISFLRKTQTQLLLVINKVDNEERKWLTDEYYSLGLGDPVLISAVHRINIDGLKKRIAESLEKSGKDTHQEKSETLDHNVQNDNTYQEDRIKLLILGKPNTGKSSLVNALTKKNRVLVSEMAGTTRDVIEEDIELFGTPLKLIDTAGIRRKNKISDDIEYYASHRALSSIEDADVVILLIDVIDGISEQDKKIATLVLRRGKGLIIGLNKWDLIKEKSNRLNAERDRLLYKVPQLHYVELCPLSAKEETGFKDLIKAVKKVYSQLFTRVNTSLLNRDMLKWVEKQAPKYVNKRRGKLKFLYQVSNNPIIFKLKVNNPLYFSESYKQYLINNIRSSYNLSNIPIILDLITN